MIRPREPDMDFDYPLLRPSVRKTDPATSAKAADAIRPALGALQEAVMAAFVQHGAMTGRDAERLPEFDDYAPSTVRKRISELAAYGLLIPCGTDTTRRAPLTIYRAAEKE